MPRAIRLFVLTTLLAAAWSGFARADLPLYVHPEDRAAGNRHAAAVGLARALLTLMWPATVQQVRIDGVSGHQVAGIVISATKFHHPLDMNSFLNEIQTLVGKTFTATDVEEVDVWAILPIPVAKGAIVSGDLAVPTTRTVFACSVRRDRLAHLAELVHGTSEVYWDQAFAAALGSPRTAGSSAAR